MQADLQAMEREAYQARWSDGIVDIYLGASLLWLGAMWTWPGPLSAVAGILPAVLVMPMLAMHKRFVEDRLGHVEWRPSRRLWERRGQLLLLGLGLGLLLLVVGSRLAPAMGLDAASLAPGIMAWLLAVLALGIGLLIDAPRLVLYAAVLAASGVGACLLGTEPGWPMLPAGAIAAASGAILLRRFVRRYPSIEPR
jgi:hypothetical protein